MIFSISGKKISQNGTCRTPGEKRKSENKIQNARVATGAHRHDSRDHNDLRSVMEDLRWRIK
jgi:hypothetical protein